MSKERELLEWALIFLHPDVSEEASNLHKEIEELLTQPEQDAITDKSTATAGSVMPNGVCASNVYDAFEAGRASVMGEQEPVAWMYDWNTKGEEEYGETKDDCLTRVEFNTKSRAITNVRPLYANNGGIETCDVI